LEMNFTDAEMQSYALTEGDLLVVEGSGSATEVGKCALVPQGYEGYAFQNTLIRIRPSIAVDSRWLMYRINAEAELAGFLRLARGVGIFHLGATRMAAWPIVLPPLDEQQRQVDRVSAELSRVRQLSALLVAVEFRTQPLRRSILKAAFEGRLTAGSGTARLLEEALEEIS